MQRIVGPSNGLGNGVQVVEYRRVVRVCRPTATGYHTMPTWVYMQQTSTSKPTSTKYPSIDQSVNQPVCPPPISHSVSRGRSSRIVSEGGLSPPRSAPQPQVSTRWPGPPIAARTDVCCCPSRRLRCAAPSASPGSREMGRAGRTRAVWTIPGRVRGGLFTNPVSNELVVRG